MSSLVVHCPRCGFTAHPKHDDGEYVTYQCENPNCREIFKERKDD